MPADFPFDAVLFDLDGTLLATDRFWIPAARVGARRAFEELGLDRDKCNVNGGAIALGHPLGATGTRLLLTLVREMEESGKALGCASACIGGGQGIAMILERA